ncbi:MAG: GP4d helicase [Podoviridae sp. ctbj_2]|nr:MAG: GP4d helicase [Podoviridae sp. ctbj_2]
MSECIEKIVHDTEDCGSHALQIFLNEDGRYTGFCFSCRTYVPDPYKDRPADYKPVPIRKTPEQIQEEIGEIQKYKTVGLPARKLKQEYLEYFGIKIGLSEQDGETPVSHHYPYFRDGELVGYKNRTIVDKRMWSSGDLKDAELFGWEQAISAGARKLFITEGECDAVALYQVLVESAKGTAYAASKPSVVSLPSGAATAGRVAARLKNEIMKHFKEEDIVLVFDMDNPGQEAVKEFRKVMPKISVATLPEKDANECLIKGKSQALKSAVVFKAAPPVNSRLVSVASVAAKAREPVPWGFSYPYKKLTEFTRGRRFGETIYIGGGVKMGKSELLNDMVAHDIMEHKWKVFCIKPEESNVRTLQGVVGKMVNRIFHDPAVEFDEAAWDKGIELIDGNLIMIDLYQELTLEVMKSDIRAAVAQEVKSVYIDPITVLSNKYAPAEANVVLQQMSQELSAMAMELQIIVHLFCHLKAPDQGPSHERGGDVLSHQFAGSRAMMRSCNTMIGIQGNKDPDLSEEDRNLRTLVLLEDRMTGNAGKIPLFWDKATGAFNQL